MDKDNKKNLSEEEFIKTRDGLKDILDTLTSLMPNEKYRQKEGIDYFQIALGHLEDLYTNTPDATNLNKIKELQNKYTTTGLRTIEYRDLAEQYRTEFLPDSFSKLETLKTSVSEDASKKVLKGLRKIVSGLIKEHFDEEKRKAYEDANDAIDTKNMLDRITSYEKELSLIPKSELSSIQNLWLLANEASESRIAKMTNESEESKMRFIDSMSTLYNFIKEEYAKRKLDKKESN